MDDASDDDGDDNNDTDKDSVDCGNSGAPQLSKSTHPRKFGNNKTVHCPTGRPLICPSAPQAHQCKITQLTGMATQMQRKNCMTARTFKERKKLTKSCLFRCYF